MRPQGEISVAILGAAAQLARVDDQGQRRGGVLQELAHTACVGVDVARRTVDNLKRAGKLEPVGERRLAHRNRPCVEYAPAVAPSDSETSPYFDMATVFAGWARG